MTWFFLRFVAIGTALLVGLAAAPAVAQGSAANDEEARALFDAGSVAFSQGRFERALEHFQRAHALSPRPQMLFNLGNTVTRPR